MISFRHLTLARGARTLIDDANLQIFPGWKVGLTGANGCGKSSLFALLCGNLLPEKGDLDIPAAWIIAQVAQETPALARAALDHVMDGDHELRQLEAALQQAEAAHDGEQMAHLHTRLGDIGAYTARARAAALLNGLGFTSADLQRPVAEFSGGWRMRLNLAQALMRRADLLLLDEPTNHLDLDAIFWLEQWLTSFPGTLFLISHDRAFLDATVDHVAQIEQGCLSLYRGNFSDSERQRAERLASQQAMFLRQQRKIAHMEDYIRRFRAKATKARQAQSRLKALSRMERIAAAHVDTPFSFLFRAAPPAPDPLLTLTKCSACYGETPVLSDMDWSLRPQDRIGILGRNGAGKSTLIKLLADVLPLSAGKRREGKGLVIGYFAQHQLETLRPDESALTHLMRLDPSAREQELRNFLGGFDFCGDGNNPGKTSATTPCGNFSGGEKSRLALALLIWQRPNLLLLDEPANHLDLDMRLALTLALQTYEGAMVLVSHDRALIETCCDTLYIVDDRCLLPFEGDLEDYRRWMVEKKRAHMETCVADGQAVGREPPRESRRQERARTAALREQRQAARRPLAREIHDLEAALATLTAEKTALEAQLTDSAIYESSQRDTLQNAMKQQSFLSSQIDTLESRWLACVTELEALDTGYSADS